jgi:hypothetical protein
MQSTLDSRPSPFTKVLVLAACFVLGWVNFFHPMIRLANPADNHAAFLLVLSLPLAALWIARDIRPSWARYALMAGVVPIACVCCLLGMFGVIEFLSIEAAAGRDLGMEPLHALPWGQSRIVTYRTDGGATTSLGIEIRRELPVFPGVLLVDYLYGMYPASEATVERGPGKSLIIDQRCSVSIAESWFDASSWLAPASAHATGHATLPPCE